MALKKLYSVLFFLYGIFFNSLFIFAEDGDWGINIRDWILRQASALAIAAVVIVVVPLIYKRQWSALIGTIFASGIALFVVNQPDVLEKIGEVLYDVIFR